MFSNPTLAETYSRVLREAAGPGGREAEIERARRVWAQGFVAEAIDKICRAEVMDVSGRPHRGRLNGADVAVWSATIGKPIGDDSGRCRVLKPGPWCQGLAALQQLALLKGLPFDGLDPAGPDFIHWQVEAAKLVFADSDTFYGDPDFAAVPTGILLGADRADSIARAAPWRHPGLRNGAHGARSGGGPRGRGIRGSGEPTVGRLGESRGDTVHFDIVDSLGNMIAATPSGGWLQSSPTIPTLGFCLGTRAQMFVLEEGHPASLAPGKRPRSTLSPTMALRPCAMASPISPGERQAAISRISGFRNFSSRTVHAGLNLQESIDAPAWHTEHFLSSFWPRAARPGLLVVESRVPESTVAELRRRGHVVEVGPAWSEGRLVAAARDRGRLKAAANPRGMQAYAAGR
jgi:gamma-glutamyltranspeptidase / glutathione hydrolase